MNADGTEQTNLSNNSAVDLHPAWSPDGTEIAFESTRAGNYEIYKMNADGSSPTNLSNNPRTEAEPDWSPDGTEIVFRSQRDNDNEIYTMNATDGSDPNNVSNDLGMIDYWPSWQPLELDTAPPSVTMTGPADGTIVNGTVALSADATDDVAVDRVEFLVNGSVVDTDATAPYSVSWDSSGVADGPATIEARAFDTSGNQATSASRTVTVQNAPQDTLDPSGTVLINGGRESTDSRTVKLRLSASDPSPGSGVASMRFKNGGTHEWSSWQPYATSASWMLSGGAGRKTVHAQYQDNAGNRSDVVHDRIRYRR